MTHPYDSKRQDKVGKAKAVKLAGPETAKFGPPDAKLQAPQFPEDRHGPKYDNDTPNDWRRGNGMKPGFDSGKS